MIFSHSYGEENILHIYGWSGSIPQEILESFSKETGIKVTYDAYDSNDILEAKLLTGKARFDLVMPSVTPNFIRQIDAKVFLPIQKEKLPHYSYLDARLLKLIAEFDPDNQYGVPLTMGTTGIAFNRKIMRQYFPEGAPKSLDLLFNPENIKKFASCGVIISDFPQDFLEAAQAYLGEVPECKDPEKLQKALNVLAKVRPFVREFTPNSDRIVRELSNGEACFAYLWSNDALMAQRENAGCSEGDDIDYVIPKEWPGLWVDMMAIPKNAKHPENAHKFIDYLLRPEVAAKIVQATFMAMPNTGLRAYLPKSLQDNPMIFIPEYALSNLRIQESLSFKNERILMRKWTHFKLGW